MRTRFSDSPAMAMLVAAVVLAWPMVAYYVVMHVLFDGLKFGGEQSDPSQRLHDLRFQLVWAGMLLALAVGGIVLGAKTRSCVIAGLFGCETVISLFVVAVLGLNYGHLEREFQRTNMPTSSPTSTHCQPRSGAVNDCPGG